jgi:AraC family transcriptional regulator
LPEGSNARIRVLRGGQFISQVVHRESRGLLVLAELIQPHGRKLPLHEHELAYVTLVLDGHYGEGTQHRFIELRPFTAIFNPSGIAHTGLVGESGTKLFIIEFRSELLRQLDLCLPNDPVTDPGTGAMLWPGMSIFSAFKAGSMDSLVLEGHLMEMLSGLTELATADRTAPSWFRRVKDRLHSQFREAIRVTDLAAEAGVHPVHLARVFRMQERQTPGDYVQRLRVRSACELLRNREISLAHVAADCGFADQSHFTRTFKRIVGTTPGAFRRALLAA